MSAGDGGNSDPAPKGTGPGGYGDDPMESEATRLMIATKRGDEAAFDVLVERLRGRAFHVARGLVGSREDALDLAQEAFLRVYRARESFREGEPFLPWFHRILRNACFTFLRDERRGERRSLSAHGPDAEPDAPDRELEDDAPAPAEVLEADERAQEFWRGFARLSGRDREILALRHFEELSYREIAHTLGIPEGTVMSRLFHARRRLRDALGEGLRAELGGGEAGR